MHADLQRMKRDRNSGRSTTPIIAEPERIPSLVVLPFANLSADKENEYFSDGPAEDIIDALTQVPGLRVMARTSAFAFRGKEQDVREIGARLNVENILEGSGRRAGNRIGVTAQLVKASDGRQGFLRHTSQTAQGTAHLAHQDPRDNRGGLEKRAAVAGARVAVEDGRIHGHGVIVAQAFEDDFEGVVPVPDLAGAFLIQQVRLRRRFGAVHV